MDDSLHCGSCRFWKRQPIDPQNLNAPRNGECRHSPPSAGALPMPNGQLANIAMYPVLPAEYPACGQHAFPPADQPKPPPAEG